MINVLEYALRLRGAGLCVLPPKEGHKRPLVNWQQFQAALPTAGKVKLWYLQEQVTGLGFVTGTVSGNLEVLDFDSMDAYDDALFHIKKNINARVIADIITQAIVEKSPKGVHWYYRVADGVYPSEKIAMFRQEDGSLKTLIETRGEGGYIVAAPTNGYSIISGSNHADIATITSSQRNTLIDCLRELSAVQDVAETARTMIPYDGTDTGKRPGDAWADSQTWYDILTPHGWTVFEERGDIIHWCKPNSEDRHCHATTGKTKGFYVFSSNAYPFEPNQSYSKFYTYAMLSHDGDVGKATKHLSAIGYGEQSKESAEWHNKAVTPSKPILDKWHVQTVKEVMDKEYEPLRYVCEEIIVEGLTIIGGAPKIGKSWLALDLCLAVGSGGEHKFLNRFSITPDIQCLYLALEDPDRRIKSRCIAIQDALPAYVGNRHVITDNSKIMTTMPSTLDRGFVAELAEYLDNNPKCRLVIVDTLICIKPVNGKSMGGNAYEADAKLLEPLHSLAVGKRIAVIVLTHLRKTGAKAGENDDPIEQLQGSLGGPSKADTLMVLTKKHKSNQAKLYVRGREIQEQEIELEMAGVLWHVKVDDTKTESAKYSKWTALIKEYSAENRNKGLTPAQFGRWYQSTTGASISNPRDLFKRLLSQGILVKANDGTYMLSVGGMYDQGADEDGE